MEVHKHPHRVMEKKKWPEYLLEFLMIFLAVFLGFFAESIREHKSDKQRLLKEMHTMIETLRVETREFGSVLWSNAIICKGLDSFRLEIDRAVEGKIDPNKLYYYQWKYGREWVDAVPSMAPMTQLQNSSMLSLIKNDTLVYAMCAYFERYTAFLAVQRAKLIRRQDILRETYKTVFDLHGFEELIQRDTLFVFWETPPALHYYYTGLLKRNPPFTLLSTDAKELKNLYMDLTLYEMEIHRFNEWLRWVIRWTIGLRDHIQQQYDLNIGKEQTRYSSIGIAGSATGKGWETSIPMRLVGNYKHQWQDTIALSVGEVKFRVDDKWDISWGNTFFPSEIAEVDGPNIPIPAAGNYLVTFNDSSRYYTFTLISKK